MGRWLPKEEYGKYQVELAQEKKRAEKELIDGIYTCEEGLILHSSYTTFVDMVNRYSQMEARVSELNKIQHYSVASGKYTSEQLLQIRSEKERIFSERDPLQSDILRMDDELKDELNCPVSPKKIIEYEQKVRKLREYGTGILSPEGRALKEVFSNDFKRSESAVERRIRSRYGI